MEGLVELPLTGRGNAYVLLYGSGEGPPGAPAEPRYVTAVSELRISRGDGHFVFPAVAPGSYRLWGFLDVDLGFRSDVDVLAQPGAGDRPAEGLEFAVAEGERVAQELRWLAPLLHEPPAFRLARPISPVVELPDLPLVPQLLELVAGDLGLLTGAAPGFPVRLADANGDGIPEDADGDGLPDLFPRLFLRFLPRPGQSVPVDGEGRAAQVIVPLLVYDPAPFLLALGGDVSREVMADRLLAMVLPQAQAIFSQGGTTSATPLGAIPVGEYELWALAATGQFWKLPNGLGERGASGQAVRFFFVHGSGLGGP